MKVGTKVIFNANRGMIPKGLKGVVKGFRDMNNVVLVDFDTMPNTWVVHGDLIIVNKLFKPKDKVRLINDDLGFGIGDVSLGDVGTVVEAGPYYYQIYFRGSGHYSFPEISLEPVHVSKERIAYNAKNISRLGAKL